MVRKKKQEYTETPERSFALQIPGHPTAIVMGEFADGDIGIQLVTERDGKEPLLTTLKLRPRTFGLLGAAMARASQGNWGHDG